ncbi:MarR family winged helix-turn-helix transcriptional regulator [Brevundimonas aveniformis]|uniref:MarR family winged helix-turn-helix transcriptional regulator n=1 Tax=Brevundimonas aveniformis TaxID=370977 RepID=UPI0024938EC6|nr:MarR family winged helix-turn-helix transcriptional regulator [Brevundimonas aveniformis]
MESREPCLCGRLRRATRTLSRLYDEALDPSGLTITQFSIMRTLTRLDHPTLGELADETSHEKSGLWRTLQPMIRDGLIETEADGRVQRVKLSDQGLMALVRAMPMWREAQRRVDRVLGPRGRALIDLLSDVEARV